MERKYKVPSHEPLETIWTIWNWSVVDWPQRLSAPAYFDPLGLRGGGITPFVYSFFHLSGVTFSRIFSLFLCSISFLNWHRANYKYDESFENGNYCIAENFFFWCVRVCVCVFFWETKFSFKGKVWCLQTDLSAPMLVSSTLICSTHKTKQFQFLHILYTLLSQVNIFFIF